MYRGLLGYFPAALFEVAAHSLDSDLRHNPGGSPEGPTWARGKSADHEDCLVRHVIDAGPRRGDRLFQMAAAPKGSSAKDARRYHLRCLAWRALAMLQEDCELDGAEPGVSSRTPSTAEQIRARLADSQRDRNAHRPLHEAEKLVIEAFRSEDPCPR